MARMPRAHADNIAAMASACKKGPDNHVRRCAVNETVGLHSSGHETTSSVACNMGRQGSLFFMDWASGNLVGIGITEAADQGHKDDSYVQAERPVRNVIQVVLDALAK